MISELSLSAWAARPAPPATAAATPDESVCAVRDGCITCGDVAVALTVVEVTGSDARCRDDDGGEEIVATELVGAVEAGDRLLVHAGVAIEHLDRHHADPHLDRHHADPPVTRPGG